MPGLNSQVIRAFVINLKAISALRAALASAHSHGANEYVCVWPDKDGNFMWDGGCYQWAATVLAWNPYLIWKLAEPKSLLTPEELARVIALHALPDAEAVRYAHVHTLIGFDEAVERELALAAQAA